MLAKGPAEPTTATVGHTHSKVASKGRRELHQILRGHHASVRQDKGGTATHETIANRRPVLGDDNSRAVRWPGRAPSINGATSHPLPGPLSTVPAFV